MTAYTVAEINNNIAKINFSDGTWTFVELRSDMTEAELDDLVLNITPPHLKTGEGTPTFLSEGASRTATKITYDEPDPNPAWLDARIEAYGSINSQLEYITENGLAAWQAHVAQIKADNPKS
jgi:hypothetical protein